MERLHHSRTVEKIRRTANTQKKATAYYILINTPIGPITLIADDQALMYLSWSHNLSVLSKKINLVQKKTTLLNKVEKQLTEYFKGHRTEFDLPLKPAGTEFQKKAWVQLQKIPYGQSISYGEQAQRLGNSKASRAVGAANGKNPIGIIIPCHRVLGANGSLTGFAGGVSIKKKLLDLENHYSSK